MGTITRAAATGVEVRLEHLRRVFAGVVALDELSLTLAPGELVALLGPSGCGKTTALRLVAGLDEVTSGKVLFGGTDVTTLGANRRDVGMVFQAYSLFPHMTARQNVAFGLQMRRVDEQERKRRADAMLELVGLSEFVGLTNRIEGDVKGGEVIVRGTRLPLVRPDTPDGQAVALVRPEAVSLGSDGDAGGDAGGGPLVGTVIAVAFLGATSRVTVDLGDVIVLAQMPTSQASAHPAGSRVRLTLRPDPVLIARDETAAAEA